MNTFQQMKNDAKFSWCFLHSDLQHGASMQKLKYQNEDKLWINKILMGCHTPIEKNVENKESINTEKIYLASHLCFSNEDENVYSIETFD